LNASISAKTARARDVVTYTIGEIRGLVAGFRAIFSGACT
jgi:hypothetical protein